MTIHQWLLLIKQKCVRRKKLTTNQRNLRTICAICWLFTVYTWCIFRSFPFFQMHSVRLPTMAVVSLTPTTPTVQYWQDSIRAWIFYQSSCWLCSMRYRSFGFSRCVHRFQTCLQTCVKTINRKSNYLSIVWSIFSFVQFCLSQVCSYSNVCDDRFIPVFMVSSLVQYTDCAILYLIFSQRLRSNVVRFIKVNVLRQSPTLSMGVLITR